MSSDEPLVVAAVVPPVISAPVISEPISEPVLSSRLPQQRLPQQTAPQGYSWIAAACWLLGSLAIMVLAAVMSVGTERRVFLPGLPVPVPELCATKARFNIDCPGCGMTRAFIHFAHGRMLDGMRMNPASFLVFLFVASQIPAAVARFVLGRTSRFAIAWCRWNELALIVLPTVTFIQWIVRMSIGVYT